MNYTPHFSYEYDILFTVVSFVEYSFAFHNVIFFRQLYVFRIGISIITVYHGCYDCFRGIYCIT